MRPDVIELLSSNEILHEAKEIQKIIVQEDT